MPSAAPFKLLFWGGENTYDYILEQVVFRGYDGLSVTCVISFFLLSISFNYSGAKFQAKASRVSSHNRRQTTPANCKTCLLNCLPDVWSFGRCQEKQQGAQRHHMQYGSRGLLCRWPPSFIPHIIEMRKLTVIEACGKVTVILRLDCFFFLFLF